MLGELAGSTASYEDARDWRSHTLSRLRSIVLVSGAPDGSGNRWRSNCNLLGAFVPHVACLALDSHGRGSALLEWPLIDFTA